MAEIINLRRARKARDRSDERLKGDANAAKHGRAKAERERDERAADIARKRLDGHRREDEE